jgi:hypothetical protein
VFDLHSKDRLAAWKKFRDSLETSGHPLEDVAELWARAPFVSDYLDPENPSKWPDPWHLILDLRLDTLAISLGMLYTIKLTQRFIHTGCEIHKSTNTNKKDTSYLLVVDNQYVLNLEYRKVLKIIELDQMETNIIWSGSKL